MYGPQTGTSNPPKPRPDPEPIGPGYPYYPSEGGNNGCYLF